MVFLAHICVVKLVNRFGTFSVAQKWQKFFARLKSIGVFTDKSIAIAGGLQILFLWHLWPVVAGLTPFIGCLETLVNYSMLGRWSVDCSELGMCCTLLLQKAESGNWNNILVFYC